MSGSTRGLLSTLLALCTVTPLHAQSPDGAPALRDTVFRAATPVLGQVGHLDVPEDRSRPGSPSIRIRFLRFEALAANPGPPIFFLAGGPGTPAVESARYQGFPMLMALRAISDVVIIDQRGTLGSEPHLRCPNRWSYPLGTVGTWDTLLGSFRDAVARCAAYWQGQGVDLAAYTTSANADDIEDLRRALGYPQVHLFGGSYGTHLGLDFIRRHPGSVDRAVFAGVQGVDQMVGLPSGAARQLEKIESLFQDRAASDAPIPSVTNGLRRLLQRLEEAPATVRIPAGHSDSTVPVSFGAFDFRLAVAQRLSHRNSVTRWLVRTLRDAERGDLTRAAQVVAADRSRRINMMGLAMNCASGVSTSRLKRIEEEAATTLLGRAPAFPGIEPCQVIPHRDLGPEFRAPVESDIPILFVSGTLDHDAVSTVRSLQRTLPNAEHVVLRNGFHNDYTDFWPLYVGHVTSFLAGNSVGEAELVLPLRFVF